MSISTAHFYYSPRNLETGVCLLLSITLSMLQLPLTVCRLPAKGKLALNFLLLL